MNKKLNWINNVHIYGLSLAIGDAHFLIDKIKSGDAYFDYFYNDDGSNGREKQPEGFVNEVKDILGKKVNCFTLNKAGLGWFPLFSSNSENKAKPGIDSYYIDFAGAENTPWFQRPKCFFGKDHIKIINSMIEKSLESKPIFELNFPSKRSLFMETKDEVNFYTEEEIKVDYSKPTNDVFEQLFNIYYNEYFKDKKKKLSFINAGHPENDFSFDFHVDVLSSDKFEVYKVESLVKDIDWYSAYYAKYHTDQKDIYKRKTTSKEDQKWIDEWTSRQPLAKEMKQILELANYDPNAPEIESFKMTVEQYGFLHGYYLKAV